MAAKDFIEIITFLISLLVLTWKLAGIKAKLEALILNLEKNFYKDLDLVKDACLSETGRLESEQKMIIYRLDDQTKALSSVNKRISGAIVFERMEQRIITLAEVVKNQGVV